MSSKFERFKTAILRAMKAPEPSPGTLERLEREKAFRAACRLVASDFKEEPGICTRRRTVYKTKTGNFFVDAHHFNCLSGKSETETRLLSNLDAKNLVIEMGGISLAAEHFPEIGWESVAS